MGRMDYSVTLKEGLEKYDAAADNALGDLEDLGITMHNTPPRGPDGKKFDGRIPVDLATRTPAEIGEFYNLMLVYADYVSSRLAVAKAALEVEKEKRDLAEAAVRKTKTGNQQQKRDESIIDSRYVQANANYIRARTFYELLSTVAEAARRDLSFISRIIETKKIEFAGNLRGTNIGGRGGRGSDSFKRRRGR